MEVLGYHISEGIIMDSNGGNSVGASFLEFLLVARPGTIRIFYDLDESVSNLLDVLKFTTEERESLVYNTRFNLPPYHLRYVPGKLFSIKRPNAFSYFANAKQYVGSNEKRSETQLELAREAKVVGERVYTILEELGIGSSSLVSPVRAYERSEIKRLKLERSKASGDPIKSSIIDGIGLGIYGRLWSRDLDVE